MVRPAAAADRFQRAFSAVSIVIRNPDVRAGLAAADATIHLVASVYIAAI